MRTDVARIIRQYTLTKQSDHDFCWYLLNQLSVHFVYFLKESQKNQDKEGQNGAQGADEMRPSYRCLGNGEQE